MDEEPGNYVEGLAALVLAAGFSARMGRNKLLMEVAARPMIRHVVETVRGVAEEVVVVVGYQAERIQEALSRSDVRFLRVDPTRGEAFSIAAGLEVLNPSLGTLVCVGDQPRLTEREIAGLVSAFSATDRKQALVPVREGRRGYPMIVPVGFDASDIDLAAENVVAANIGRVAAFQTRNPVYESGIDTMEDYRALFTF